MTADVVKRGLRVFLGWWFCLMACDVAHGQRPQDNWYHAKTWTKSGGSYTDANGGLSQPYGVAVGTDGKVFVADQGYGRIQVYNRDSTYAFSITNGFGGGLSFSQPRGMIVGHDGNLYLADAGHNKVFVFDQLGGFVRQIGAGTGSGPGQMSGARDVGVSRDGEIFVLEQYRVSVFSLSGEFLRSWGGQGTLEGQLYGASSIAVASNGQVFIGTACNSGWGNEAAIKVFSGTGVYLRRQEIWMDFWNARDGTVMVRRLPGSVRFDDSGLLHVIVSGVYGPHYWNESLTYMVFTAEGSGLYSANVSSAGSGDASIVSWQCSAIGPDGTCYLFNRNRREGNEFSLIYRNDWVSPRNAIPQPGIIQIQQRPNSPLVDIDYQVTDMDDAMVHVGMVAFTNASQALATCQRRMTFVEGTETNLGADVRANLPHRVTWNAGADLNTKLGDFRVALLVRDSRQKLLDIHYIRLPADRGMPDLKISRSPLIPNDLMQVWWWLLATQDTGISLTGGKIYGAGGSLDGKLLCDAAGTTADGRSYIYAKLGVREASGQEVQWAKEGALAGNVNQWSPTRTVGGRPLKVNEYGFDTGSWGANAWWVVPLD